MLQLQTLVVFSCLQLAANGVQSHVLEREKDYETTMGRILAVNMEHIKGSIARDERQENVFGEIEQNNEKKQLSLYQGDIILDQELKEILHGSNMSRNKRNAVREKKLLWKTRKIPFYVPPHMAHIRSNVIKAINNFHENTCLRFMSYDPSYASEPNYILFDNDYGCSSRVGVRYAEKGYQKVSIGDGCNHVGTIIHELMHAIGFFHEQSREDRNTYVKINWDNILDGVADQFNKYSWITLDDLGKLYDYQSIMHYDRKAFTKNGLPTIVRIDDETFEFGPVDQRLSQKDIIEIKALYDCTSTTQHGWASWTDYTPCDANCRKTRERYCYHSGNKLSCGGNTNGYGIEKDTVDCTEIECKAIAGGWGHWSAWSDCGVTCGEGEKIRIRQCDNPTPMHGGKTCEGDSKETGACGTRRCVLDFDDTDFEAGFGMWSNSFNDKLNWQRHQGFTQTVDTGPSVDHTLGNNDGYYLYVESSSPAQANDNALLESPLLNSVAGGQCLKFYYSMYGATTGKLMVHIEEIGGAKYLLFHKDGNQGMGWKSFSKNIEPTAQYKLTFEAIIADYGYSDIAIDDVYIDPGLCTGCVDSDTINCPKWAIQGECENNALYMTDNCKKSCAVCGCKDDFSNCPTWQQDGECEKNPVFMLANCQLSCKVCGCKDLDPSCATWAQGGECGSNPAYMLQNCCRSCRCENWVKNEDCNGWASVNQCTDNPDYMRTNCKKSCGVC